VRDAYTGALVSVSNEEFKKRFTPEEKPKKLLDETEAVENWNAVAVSETHQLKGELAEAEKQVERLSSTLYRTRDELRWAKEGVVDLTQIYDRLVKERDSIRDELERYRRGIQVRREDGAKYPCAHCERTELDPVLMYQGKHANICAVCAAECLSNLAQSTGHALAVKAHIRETSDELPEVSFD
jgi:hypothetical protein